MSSKPHFICCGNVSESKPPVKAPKIHRLSVHEPDANVFVEYAALTELFWGEVQEKLIDLITIAAYAYSADQAISRGKGDSDEYGEGWRRKLFYRIEVKDHAFWNQDHVKTALVDLLSFLTEDEYHFEFCPWKKSKWQPSIEYGIPAFEEVDDVMLFSGGLDSLAGAIQKGIAERQRMIWVKHHANPKYFEKHDGLAKALQQKLGKTRSYYVTVKINKSKELKEEPIQRTRSFLFGAMALVIAEYVKKDRILFFENGVVSLNLPPSAQVVGARATRTTHPYSLELMQRLFTLIVNRPFKVMNPFLWKTKHDIVEIISENQCSDLIAESMSCAKTRSGSLAQPHCGVCSQCIDRRFAILSAAQEQYDPVNQYKVELIRGKRENSIDLTMLASYVEMSRRVRSMSQATFFSQFGEAVRALRYVGMPVERAAVMIYELYVRHAKHVVDVVEDAVSRNSKVIISREFESNSLLALTLPVSRASRTQVHCVVDSDLPYVFILKGAAFIVRFEGEAFILLNHRGAQYLQQLLAKPRTQISCANLMYNVLQEAYLLNLSEGSKVNQSEERKVYYARLAEIREEIEEATEAEDSEKLNQLEEARIAIIKDYQRRYDRNGKSRVEGSDLERVRKAVSNAMKHVLDEIEKYSPPMYKHLRQPTLRGGSYWYYDPAEDIIWVTDPSTPVSV